MSNFIETETQEIAGPMDAHHRKVRVALYSVACNTFLVVTKLIIGVLIGSVSVISEAIHSGVDLLAALIALFSVKTSSNPADEKHPFGHGKIENISGTIEALLIFVAAAWIIWEAYKKIVSAVPMMPVGWGVIVMFVSSVANYIITQMLFKVGRETDSIALMADGWHHLTDVYTSAGVMASLAVIWSGKIFLPNVNLDWIDPIAAIAVALLIFKAAWDLTRESAGPLMDETLPSDEADEIRRIILSQMPIVHGYHQLRTRKSGHYRFIEVHIQVDAKMSVEIAHRLTQDLAKRVKERFAHATVTIHTEPCNGACEEKCRAGCLLAEAERLRVQQTNGKRFASTNV
jgi:cation diffusion facilitator family transporter